MKRKSGPKPAPASTSPTSESIIPSLAARVGSESRRVGPRSYVTLLVGQPTVDQGGLPMTARAVAHVIATFADFETGANAWPSYSTIAKGAGLSRRSAIDQVNVLVRAGWLIKTAPSAEAARRRSTTRYDLAVPEVLVRVLAPELVRGLAPGSATARTRTSEPDDTSLVRALAPNQVKDHRARTRARARCPHGRYTGRSEDGEPNCPECRENWCAK